MELEEGAELREQKATEAGVAKKVNVDNGAKEGNGVSGDNADKEVKEAKEVNAGNAE